jgi:hypothetical protein
VQIAAVLSGDDELLRARLSGDVYLGIAKLLGLAPEDATPMDEGDCKKTEAAFVRLIASLMFRTTCDLRAIASPQNAGQPRLSRA